MAMLDPKSLKNGHEQFQEYYSATLKKVKLQYDYRHYDGKLFSCVKNTVNECRIAKDQWIERISK